MIRYDSRRLFGRTVPLVLISKPRWGRTVAVLPIQQQATLWPHGTANSILPMAGDFCEATLGRRMAAVTGTRDSIFEAGSFAERGGGCRLNTLNVVTEQEQGTSDRGLVYNPCFKYIIYCTWYILGPYLKVHNTVEPPVM